MRIGHIVVPMERPRLILEKVKVRAATRAWAPQCKMAGLLPCPAPYFSKAVMPTYLGRGDSKLQDFKPSILQSLPTRFMASRKLDKLPQSYSISVFMASMVRKHFTRKLQQ